MCSGRRSEEHTSELQSHVNLVCRLLLEKKKLFAARSIDWNSSSFFRQTIDRAMLTIIKIDKAELITRLRTTLSTPSPFFFNDTATTEIYTLSLHDALPI